MAVDWSVKQTNLTVRLSQEIVIFLASADRLASICVEYGDDAYGTGGANAITDAAVQSYLPAATALNLAQAEGALSGDNAILATITANRGYLELLRP